jgi:hypothetical protein
LNVIFSTPTAGRTATDRRIKKADEGTNRGMENRMVRIKLRNRGDEVGKRHL